MDEPREFLAQSKRVQSIVVSGRRRLMLQAGATLRWGKGIGAFPQASPRRITPAASMPPSSQCNDTFSQGEVEKWDDATSSRTVSPGRNFFAGGALTGSVLLSLIICGSNPNSLGVRS